MSDENDLPLTMRPCKIRVYFRGVLAKKDDDTLQICDYGEEEGCRSGSIPLALILIIMSNSLPRSFVRFVSESLVRSFFNQQVKNLIMLVGSRVVKRSVSIILRLFSSLTSGILRSAPFLIKN